MCPSLSTSSLPPLQPKRSRTRYRGVSFSKKQEVYVGEETSNLFLKWHVDLQPLLCHSGVQGYIHEIECGDENFTLQRHVEDDDETSWMSTWTVGHDRDVQNIQNHGQPAVTNDPDAVHLDDAVIREDEGMSEAGETSSSASDSAADRRTVIVYSIDHDPLHCRPRWQTYEQLHADVAHQFCISSHDLTMLHHVHATPEDLLLARIHAFIAQKPQDITEGSTFQLVLLDVEFHSALPSLEPESVRRVKLLPKPLRGKLCLLYLDCSHIVNMHVMFALFGTTSIWWGLNNGL